MIRLVIAIAIAIIIAGSIIFIISRIEDPPPILQVEEPLLSSPATETVTVSVSINAIPWARVFIKLPENDHFMGPRARDFTIPPESNGRNSNVTPIPGDLKVPIGTTIKLLHRGKEKIFPYEAWKDGKTISHDFLNQ